MAENTVTTHLGRPLNRFLRDTTTSLNQSPGAAEGNEAGKEKKREQKEAGLWCDASVETGAN